tara:strand:- start:163 stop:2334 length:2172 start_codon:yes stop_codon:yes gene_type:complete
MDDLSATFSEYFTNKGHDGYVFKDPITGEVREHIGEMPLPWGEYPDNIEPESKEAAAYDLSRGAVRALPSQIIERDFLASQGELPEGSQIDDPYWITASKVLHDYMGHSDFKQALQKRPGIRPNQTEPMTPEDYAEWGVGFMSQFNWNMSAMLINTAKLADAPAEVAKSMYYLMETSDRTGMNFSNFTQGMGNLFKDPTTYVGLGTFGIGVAGKVAGKQMTKAGLKQVLRDIVLSKPTTATLAVGVEGAMYGAADDLARQTVETRVTGEDISLGQAATSATVGAVAGERFAAGLPALGEAVVRGGKQLIENLQREGEMPDVGMNAGQLFQGAEPVKVDADEAVNVLNLRAEQMELAPKDRVQPSGEVMFDTSAESYARTFPEQIETPVPRAPEGKALPLGDRARKVIEMSDAISDKLAERAKPFVGTNVQFFYNTGPIIDKAIELGYSKEQAFEALRKFALNYAATSPRAKTEENLRSASLAGVKQERGIDIGTIIGPGGSGINEKGYPMIINPGGLHRKLLDDVMASGISFDTNPKPATFAENVSGNLAGVTVDTHAIRAVFDVLNELEPGSIPLKFIGGKTAAKTKEFQEMYQKDPSSFDAATMVADTLQSQKIDGKDMQTEYAVFSDIYKQVAEKLGVKPAEAQSLSWFANGDKTGLASEPKTIVELIDDRVDVTAQLTGMSKDEVFKKFFQGSIPLLSLGGGVTLLETGSSMYNSEDGA